MIKEEPKGEEMLRFRRYTASANRRVPIIEKELERLEDEADDPHERAIFRVGRLLARLAAIQAEDY